MAVEKKIPTKQCWCIPPPWRGRYCGNEGKFKALIEEHAESVETDEWGKRRLAYPINDENEGFTCFIGSSAP